MRDTPSPNWSRIRFLSWVLLVSVKSLGFWALLGGGGGDKKIKRGQHRLTTDAKFKSRQRRLASQDPEWRTDLLKPLSHVYDLSFDRLFFTLKNAKVYFIVPEKNKKNWLVFVLENWPTVWAQRYTELRVDEAVQRLESIKANFDSVA